MAKAPKKPFDVFVGSGLSPPCRYFPPGSGKSVALKHLIEDPLVKLWSPTFFMHEHYDLFRKAHFDFCVIAKGNAATAREAIAHTVWKLWMAVPDELWQLLESWSVEGGVLAEASHEIVRYGLDKGHLTAEGVLERIDEGIRSGGQQRAQAFGRLILPVLPSLSQKDLTALGQGLGENTRTIVPALAEVVVSYFRLDSQKCIEVLKEWSKSERELFEEVCTIAVPRWAIRKDQPAPVYVEMTARLRSLASTFKADHKVRVSLSKLIQRAKDLRSQALNEARKSRARRKDPIAGL